MDKDFVDALIANLKHLEDRISFIRAREPHQHHEFNELMARLRACATKR
ncbi:hypothetical protein [Bradyrhizobium sp. UFLA05-112]